MNTKFTENVFKTLLPELEKLSMNAPQFGEILLRANLHDGNIVKISLGSETTRKAEFKKGGKL